MNKRISGPNYLITVLSNQFHHTDPERKPVSVMEAGPWNR